ncbi:TonB-dependent receptor [Novosphingobium sp. Gsoil 351]|nr:TonB-dependent receptor [Novosphingobium sp. Gsoil 351]
MINGVPVNNTLVSNAAKVTNIGFEAELTARPIPHLTLSANTGYVHPKYDSFIDATGTDVRNQRIIFVPRWTYALSAQYEHELSDRVSFTGSVDYSWTDTFAADRCVATGPVSCWTSTAVDMNGLTAAQIGQNIVDATTIKAAGIFNARLTFGLDDDNYRLSLWGRNLTDNRDPFQATYLNANPRNYVGGYIRDPATYGATVAVRF